MSLTVFFPLQNNYVICKLISLWVSICVVFNNALKWSLTSERLRKEINAVANFRINHDLDGLLTIGLNLFALLFHTLFLIVSLILLVPVICKYQYVLMALSRVMPVRRTARIASCTPWIHSLRGRWRPSGTLWIPTWPSSTRLCGTSCPRPSCISWSTM